MIKIMAKINPDDLTIKDLSSDKFLKELPEVYSLKNNVENNPWHHNQTTFSHTILVLKALIKNFERYKHLEIYLNEKIEKQTRQTILFIAALYHDIAKPITRKFSKENWTTFPMHETKGAKYARGHLKKFDLTPKEIDLKRRRAKGRKRLTI